MDPVNRAIRSLAVFATSDYIGEPVSQLEHALQSAYFAEKSGHSDEVILASLFHDIGHFASETEQRTMAHLGIMHHEWIGAKLAYDMGFSNKIALLIGYHVDAKRYLAGKKPNYYERLSIASKGTLAHQGGPMSESEMSQLEQHVFFKEILQVRVNDEKGKEIGLVVPDLYSYQSLIKKHIQPRLKEDLVLENFIDHDWVEKFKQQLL